MRTSTSVAVTAIISTVVGCVAATAPSATPAVERDLQNVHPLVLPASQSSVTSTAFDPDKTNAGGTTNSAGTFDVSSLARSSSYEFDSKIPQTTSYVVSDPQFGSTASMSTPVYYTGTVSQSTKLPKTATEDPASIQSSLTAGKDSLPSSASQASVVNAPSGDSDAAVAQLSRLSSLMYATPMAIVSATMLFGAMIVL